MKPRRPSLTFIALLCVSVLFVRLGGMHLHLCLDGQETASEMHWSDAGIHNDEEHTSQAHDDRDIDYSDIVGKTSKSFGDLPLAVLAAILLFAFVRTPRLRPSVTAAIFPLTPSAFLPPLRGPPL